MLQEGLEQLAEHAQLNTHVTGILQRAGQDRAGDLVPGTVLNSLIRLEGAAVTSGGRYPWRGRDSDDFRI